MGNRQRRQRYWGPVLVAVGVLAGIISTDAVKGAALAWALGACAVLILTGITLIAAARQNV